LGLVAVLVKLTSAGLFFIRSRGFGEAASFPGVQFRTMLRDADQLLEQHLEKYPREMGVADKPEASERPRLTPVGDSCGEPVR